MMTHSFKSLAKSGVLKRVDGLRVHLNDLHIEPGFNLRERGASLDEHIQNIKRAIMAGEPIAPIEVRVSDEGLVLVVDGHCRREAYIAAAADGAPVEWLDVVQFRGNDVDRVARIITSQEGRKLTPLELAMGYKRLAAFRMDSDAIAKRFNKTRQHVDQMLLLAFSNDDVHQLVRIDRVSASLAVEAVRQHGEKAGEVLRGHLEAAQQVGKKKVTAGTIKGPKVPAKVLQGIVEEIDAFVSELSRDARVAITEIENHVASGGSSENLVVEVPASAILSLMAEFAKLTDARTQAIEKHAAKVAKAAQRDIEDEAA